MKKPRFDFLSSARFVTSFSLVLSLFATGWILLNGLNYGIDFAGGNEIRVRFQNPPTAGELRKYVSQFAKPSVQTFGDEKNEFLIFIENITEESITSSTKTKPGEDTQTKRENTQTKREDTQTKREDTQTKREDTQTKREDTQTKREDTQTKREDNTFRVESANALTIESLLKSLKKDFADRGVEIRKVDSVGPQIGSELRKKGILAIFYSLIMILIYLAVRFDYKFAPPAVICLFHDTVLTLWIFALFDLSVSVQTLAALLAIIGYSLNDTIVTFDRIRENTEYFAQKESFLKLCNRSINDVLSRTLLTSFTTLVAVGMMWFYTDGVIKDFAFTLGVGVAIGTYSSIYVAVPLVIFIHHLQTRKAG